MQTAKWASFALALLITYPALAAETTELRIVVEGATPGNGSVILSLFDSQENYLKTPLLERVQATDERGMAEFLLLEITPTSYAIAVVDDADNDGKMNTGFMGIPTEKVGFSNNARGRFGPPKFEAAVFELSAPTTISIRLGKAKN